MLHAYANGDSADAVLDQAESAIDEHQARQLVKALRQPFADEATHTVNSIASGHVRKVDKPLTSKQREILEAARAEWNSGMRERKGTAQRGWERRYRNQLERAGMPYNDAFYAINDVSKEPPPLDIPAIREQSDRPDVQSTTPVVDAETLTLRTHTEATNYAANRGAELVGRKWVNGELVDNPNAKWAITDTNRDVTRDLVNDGVALHWDVDKLADRLNETGLYSDARAETIARTEVSRAQNAGMLEAGRQARKAGLNMRKQWTLGDNPCEICQGIADDYDDDQDLDTTFEPSDDDYDDVDAPPLHPNCDCTLELVEGDDDE